MPQLKMTDKAVQAVTVPPGERVDFFDAHPRDRQRGLVLRVSATEKGVVSKTWAVLYRMKGSTQLRRATIGDYPSYSLARARTEAAEIVQAARRGEDLVKQRKAAALAQAGLEGDTIEAVSAEFLKDWSTRPKKRGGKRAEAYLDHLQRYLDLHILPRWKGRRVGELTRADGDALVTAVAGGGGRDAKGRRIPGGGTTANRVLALLKALGNWCVKKEKLEANPFHLIDRPAGEVKRERVLAADELRDVWAAFGTVGYPFGGVGKLLALTGTRLSEVAGMRWGEVDESAAVWTIPSARAKGRRVHLVPLSDAALAVLAEAKANRMSGAEVDYVFTTTGRSAVSGWSRAKSNVDAAITETRKEAGQKPLAPWTWHTLRHTFGTQVTRLEFAAYDTLRQLFGHADKGITDQYLHDAYVKKQTAALQAWATYLIGVVTGKPASVSSIATARRRRKATSAA
jgi:integrase